MKLAPRFLLFLALIAAQASARPHRLTVPAPAEDRVAQVVTITLPADAPRSAVLRAASGEVLPLQAAGDGTAQFVIPVQRAGARLEFLLEAASAPPDGVTVEQKAEGLHLIAGGRTALTYRTDKASLPRADIDPKYKRAGYLHPLLTPSGRVVTGDFPSNHVHHHGIWSPWTKTKFQGRAPDFWNMQDRTGTVELERVECTWGGPVHGGFVAHHRMVDLSAPSPTTALNETWAVTFYRVPGAPRPLHVIDLVITQACATADALVLPKYHYGGLGYRGSEAWEDKANFSVLTSEGVTDRVKANDTRVRWIFAGGRYPDGAEAGVVLLDHPGNFRAPQPVRVHPAMPYWSITPSQLGDWSIEPGKPYVARYRFLAHDGAADRALAEAAWAAFAQPVTAMMEAL